jgi:hypothetical protein
MLFMVLEEADPESTFYSPYGNLLDKDDDQVLTTMLIDRLMHNLADNTALRLT